MGVNLIIRRRDPIATGALVALVVALLGYVAQVRYGRLHTTIEVDQAHPIWSGRRFPTYKPWPFNFSHGILRCQHEPGIYGGLITIQDSASGKIYVLSSYNSKYYIKRRFYTESEYLKRDFSKKTGYLSTFPYVNIAIQSLCY